VVKTITRKTKAKAKEMPKDVQPTKSKEEPVPVVVGSYLTNSLKPPPPIIELWEPLLGLTVQPCGEPCGCAAGFDCESYLNTKEIVSFRRRNLCLWIVLCSIFGKKISNFLSDIRTKSNVGRSKNHSASSFAEQKNI
jgi:hypothetical protein